MAFRIHLGFLSLLLGGIFGLSIYSYWLIDLFPPTSQRILLYTFLAALVGAVGYYALLDFWIVPRWRLLSKAEKRRAVVWGWLIGVLLMYGGTSAWTTPTRYLSFLLPKQTLEITARPLENGETPEVRVLWISTSLGDVSFDEVTAQGWERRENQLVLTNPTDNFVQWKGRTGEDTLVLLNKSPQGGVITLSWNQDKEVLDLRSNTSDTFAYKRQFEVPFYASTAMVQALVLINFVLLGLAAYLLFLKERNLVDDLLVKSLAHSSLHVPEKKGNNTVAEYIPVMLLFLVAVLLRIFNLDHLYPYADEYQHLIAAKQLLQGMSLNAVYDRSLYIVTVPVVGSYLLFGQALWAARLPGVLFNALGIFPLYLIGRRVNRSVALLSCVLFATSPYMIAFSRNVREYAYYPFVFYWLTYFMILLLERMPASFVISRDWKTLIRRDRVLALMFILFPLYVIYIDPYSTFKSFLVAYGLLFFLLLPKLDLRNTINRLFLAMLGVLVLVIFFEVAKKLLLGIALDFRSLQFFFPNPPQQWYYDRTGIVAMVALMMGVYLVYVTRRLNPVPLLLLVFFLGFMLFFMVFFSATRFNIHPRFTLSVQVWFIPFMAMGVYALWHLLRATFKKWAFLPALLLVVSSFNISQSLLPTFFRGEYMPITRLIHDDFDAVHAYLTEHANKSDTLVGGVYVEYITWTGDPEFERVYPYSFAALRGKEPTEYISSIIAQHPSGWIVLDELRLVLLPHALVEKNMTISGKEVIFVGRFTNQYVWRWKAK